MGKAEPGLGFFLNTGRTGISPCETPGPRMRVNEISPILLQDLARLFHGDCPCRTGHPEAAGMFRPPVPGHCHPISLYQCRVKFPTFDSTEQDVHNLRGQNFTPDPSTSHLQVWDLAGCSRSGYGFRALCAVPRWSGIDFLT